MYFSNFLELAEGRKQKLKDMFDKGHEDITGNIPNDPEYKERRKSAVKKLMKSLRKESVDANLKEAPNDWIKAQHAKAKAKENQEKKNQSRPDDSRRGHVKYNLGGTTFTKNTKDPYTIDDKAPKNIEYGLNSKGKLHRIK